MLEALVLEPATLPPVADGPASRLPAGGDDGTFGGSDVDLVIKDGTAAAAAAEANKPGESSQNKIVTDTAASRNDKFKQVLRSEHGNVISRPFLETMMTDKQTDRRIQREDTLPIDKMNLIGRLQKKRLIIGRFFHVISSPYYTQNPSPFFS